MKITIIVIFCFLVSVSGIASGDHFPLEELRNLSRRTPEGRPSLSMNEVAGLPLLTVPLAEVTNHIGKAGLARWSSFIMGGDKQGYSSELWSLGTRDGRVVVIRSNQIVFPDQGLYTFTTWFEAAGAGRILHLEYSEDKQQSLVKATLALGESGWVLRMERNGEALPERVFPAVEETLCNNDLAWQVYLGRERRAPGTRFRLAWFNPSPPGDSHSGVQILNAGEDTVAGRRLAFYRVETLEPGSRQHWRHLLDAGGNYLLSSYHGRELYVTTREEAIKSGGFGIEKLLQYLPLLLGPVIMGIVFIVPWFRQRRGARQ